MSEMDSDYPSAGSQPDSAVGEQGKAPGEASTPPARCTCQRCGLYRWYPPMMLGSTVLAAIFCWMYITKPVFLTAPSGQTLDPQPAIQEKSPVDEAVPAPHTAGRGNLDPALGRLPGDAAADSSTSPVEELLGAKLEPLVVEREVPSLFEPVPVNRPPGPVPFPSPATSKVAGPVVIKRDSAPEPLVIRMEEVEPARVQELPGEDRVKLVDAGERRQNSDSEEFQVRASFMAEFSSARKNSRAPSDLDP